jgi:hypothetical protein
MNLTINLHIINIHGTNKLCLGQNQEHEETRNWNQ